MKMKIALLTITFLIGVVGWLKPEKTPTWLQISVLCGMALALVFQILLETKAAMEAKDLRSKLAEVHASETARAAFELAVSGTTISTRDQWVSLPEEGDELSFEFKLKNVGSATATDVQAFLWTPAEIRIPFLGKHWVYNGVPVKPGSPDNERVVGVSEYAFVSPVSINVGNWLTTGHGRLPVLGKGVEIPFRLKVYAAGGVFQEWTFGVRQERLREHIAKFQKIE